MVRIEKLGMVFITGFKRRKVTALKDLTMEVKRGEVFGFLGPNGAGKTTTLKILMGLIYQTSGRAWIMDREVGDVRAKSRVGFLPEQPYFYDYLTAMEFLDFYGRLFNIPKQTRRDRATDLLRLVGLSHVHDMQLRRFSKGMLQRVGIAQALINDPELVILDEPMSGLDPIGRKEVKDIIMGLKEAGKTIFFSTHILPDVEVICDRVGMLVKGELKATGTVGELLGGMKARSMEMAVEGLAEDGINAFRALSVNLVIRDSQVVAFFDDPEKARQARKLVYEKGGDILSFIPHKGSLEDLFYEEVRKGGRQ